MYEMNDQDSSRTAGTMKSDAPQHNHDVQPEMPRTLINGSDNAQPDGGSWLTRLFSRKRSQGSIRDDLEDALSNDQPESTGFSVEEKTMLTNILALQNVRVEDIMVPRADIEAVETDISLGELLKQFEDSAHSRMPVYAETLDDPRGMVHIRDVVAHITSSAKLSRAEIAKRKVELPANLDLRKVPLSKALDSLKIIRPVLFVPPSMLALDLMARMQANRIQMALVIDEYGGTDGLVSMEDIMEMIVGDIEDEHDTDDADLIREKSEGIYICNAKAELEDVEEVMGASFNAGDLAEDVDTIGGLVFALAGRVPVRGEVIEGLGFEFRVLDADPRRVKIVEFARASRKRARPTVVPNDKTDEKHGS